MMSIRWCVQRNKSSFKTRGRYEVSTKIKNATQMLPLDHPGVHVGKKPGAILDGDMP